MLRTLSRSCVAVVLLVGSGWTAPAHAGPLPKATRARAAAAKGIERYTQGRFRARQSQPTKYTGKTGRVFRAESLGRTRDSVYVRIPRIGAEVAARRHQVARMLAVQLGEGALVPPAAAVKLAEPIGEGTFVVRRADGREFKRNVSAGQTVMVVEDLGRGYKPYRAVEKTDESAAQRVPESLRVHIALIHVLMRQLDGNGTNLLLAEGKEPRLIDHDVSLGVKHTVEVRGSIFFPGRPLAYASRQDSVSDLPAEAQALVNELASGSKGEIAQAYGVTRAEANVLRTMAKSVQDHGLTGAIQRFVAEFGNLTVERKKQRRQAEEFAASEGDR